MIAKYDKAKEKLEFRLLFTPKKKHSQLKQEFCDRFGILIEDYDKSGDVVHVDCQMKRTSQKFNTPEIRKALMEIEPHP